MLKLVMFERPPEVPAMFEQFASDVVTPSGVSCPTFVTQHPGTKRVTFLGVRYYFVKIKMLPILEIFF